MSFPNLFKAGVAVGFVSVLYNFFVFYVAGSFPSLSFGFDSWGPNVFLLIFLKNFLTGMVLAFLFAMAYKNILSDTGESGYTLRAVLYFVLYAIFALLSFTLGDMLYMGTSEGILLLLTIDGVVESIIVTIPIRIFAVKD